MNRTRNQRKRANKQASNTVMTLPQSVKYVMPDKFRTRLQYWKAISFNNALPTPQYFIPSNAFDVDPALASTALPGFSEFASFYSHYRVLGAKITLEMSTTSTVAPVMLTCIATNRIQTAVSITDFVHWRSNPHGFSRTLAPTGGPMMTVSRYFSTEAVYGSKEVLYESEFASAVTTGPVNNWYVYVVNYQFPSTGSNTYVNITIEPDIEFFERKVLLN
jgi:hypothetical protein